MGADFAWPDATLEVVRWLTDELYETPVRWAVPTSRPGEFVVVRRAGSGSPMQWADRAALDVECWSGGPDSSPKPAHELAAEVRRALLAAPGGVNPIADVTITGVAFLPDAVSRCPRVVIGAEVLIRATDELVSDGPTSA